MNTSEEIKALEESFGIFPVNYRCELNINGKITELSLFDDDDRKFPVPAGNIFEVLAGFHKLESISINIGGYALTDISPLLALKQLKSITMEGIAGSLTGLEQLKHLENLTISGSKITDFSPIAGITYLKHLTVENCGLTDIAFVSGLQRLISLNLNSNQISDISALTNLSQLKQLYLKDNHINDALPVNRFADLEIVDLRGNGFGKHIFYKNADTDEPGTAPFYTLYQLTGNHYLEKEQYEEALAYAYQTGDNLQRLKIYDQLMRQEPPLDDYHFEFYAVNSLRIIQGKVADKDALETAEIKRRLPELILESRLLDRKVLSGAVEHGRDYYYNDAQEHRSFVVNGKNGVQHPEMIYRMATKFINKQDIEKSIFLYKKLVELDSPFRYPLYHEIDGALSNKLTFSYNEKNDIPDQERAMYHDMLDNILTKRVPHFDYLNYNPALESYQTNLHTSSNGNSSSYSVGLRTWIVLIIVAIRLILWIMR